MVSQPSLFEDPEPAPATFKTWRECLVEQIIRDSAVLREGPTFQVPNREFFEERIARYKEDLSQLDAL